MTPAKQAAKEIYQQVHLQDFKTWPCPTIEELQEVIQRAILQEVALLQAVIDARGVEITRLLEVAKSSRAIISEMSEMLYQLHKMLYGEDVVRPESSEAWGQRIADIDMELRKQVGDDICSG